MSTVDSQIDPPKPSLIRRLARRLFAFETMSGNGACPVYLERWELFSLFGKVECYLHHFIGDDWAIDPHDHPRRFISIGLRGWYFEDVFERNGQRKNVTKFQAPWFRSFPAEHLHRVRASECGDCWTLVIVLPKSRSWGFVKNGAWIPFRRYVFGGLFRKAC